MADLRSLPKVDALSRAERLSGFPERVRTQAARLAVDLLRSSIQNGQRLRVEDAEEIALNEALRLVEPSLGPAINLCGVILHTGLGRARLAPSVAARIAEVAASHSLVELDRESGKRGDRQAHARALLQALTGAEETLVVNNAAAGVFLSLSALCAGREVILSRGQMVEIGGSFRMPDIVRQSGCRLVEVGCTNKTRMSDYTDAFTGDTAAILRCHPSNFKIVGFSEEPSLSDLVGLARERGALCIDDVGSGCLVDTAQYGLSRQPTMQEAVEAGADVVIASGDKLLGGPQAGLIVGRREAIEAIRRHPLARAVRVDKLTLAGLEATLRLYTEGRECEIPVIRYLSRPLDEVRGLAEQLAASFPGASIEEGQTEVGGGSVPGEGIATWRAGLPSDDPDALAKRLRNACPAVIGRIEQGRVWLDPRTAEDGEIERTAEVLGEVGK
jgi:L-seryl-tRNA(Ser) seleniumtransferase